MSRPDLNQLKNNPFQTPSLRYPSDLGSNEQEAYCLFDIRDGVAKNAASRGTLALYMPASIKVAYDLKYDEWSDFLQNFNSAVDTWAQDARFAAEEYAARGGLSIAATVIPGTGPKGPNAGESELSLLTQRAINPHMAVMFRGIGFRTFQFNFKLIASSAQESDIINQIIFWFKWAAHPDIFTKDTKSFDKFLTFPDNFLIHLASPATKYLFNISTCVLTNITVDYNGSQVPAFFQTTGAPVHISMNLTFKETEIMTKTRIAQGY